MDLFKRAASAAVALVALCSIALGAGSIQLSGTQQFDTLGRPLSGGLLYTFQSGTTTPQSAFQDQALTIPYPNPMTLDASGRAPFFYLADGNIKIRLTDSTGVTIIATDGLLVIGPSAGGGGGAGVDATTVLATGDIKSRYGTGVLSGFVRLNGRTIGSATSGATERANSDAQALFEYLWNTDPNLTVSSGRGGTSNADWLANKTITLPDARGRMLAGMDDMGTTAASRLTSTYFGTSAIVLGAVGGGESQTLVAANLAAHTHSNSLTDPTHTHGTTEPNGGIGHIHGVGSLSTHVDVRNSGVFGSAQPAGSNGGGADVGPNIAPTGQMAFATASITVNAISTGISITNGGCTAGCASTAFRAMGPAMVVTLYQKL